MVVVELPEGVDVHNKRGVIELTGLFTIAEASEEWVEVFVLPEGYRPDGTVVCGLESETRPLELWIEPDGSVLADAPRPGWVKLERISFEAAG